MKTVLFLDVDGVLNGSKTKERSPHGTYGIEPGKAELIRRIMRETQAEIVLSSTWRKWSDLVHHIWENLGTDLKSRWAGNTPVLDAREGALWTAKTRGDEIAAWLKKHPEVERFVIVDDDSDMGALMSHLVHTNGFDGLTPELTEEVIRRLNAT